MGVVHATNALPPGDRTAAIATGITAIATGIAGIALLAAGLRDQQFN